MPVTYERPGRSTCPCRGTQNSDALTEARAQRNNESLANAAIVFTTEESLDALKFVIEQLLQFYKTSAKVSVETVQYALDSTYKVVQEEWTRIVWYDSVGVRANHPRDACCGKGSAGSVHPRAPRERSAAPRSEVAANGSKR